MYKVKNILSKEKMAADIVTLTFDPYDNQNIVNEGNRLFNEGQLEEALQLYRVAYDNESNNENVVYNLGYLLYRLQEYGEALSYFTLAVEIKEDFIAAVEFKLALEAKLLELSRYTMISYR